MLSDLDVKSLTSGNGSNKNFTIPFAQIESNPDHIKVYLVDASNVETLQTKTTHYTLSPNEVNPTTVVFVTAPTSSQRVMIYRDVPFTQVLNAINTGPFQQEDYETQLDLIVMMIQQLDERLDRTIRYKKSDGSGDMVLPSVASRAGKYLTFDSNGLPTVTDSQVIEEYETSSHTITDGQSATDLDGETVDAEVYTSVMYYMEITRGTTVFAHVISAMQYLNNTWRIVQGSALALEAHGVTLSVSQSGTVGQLRAALNSGAGNGTIKIKKHYFSA